MVVVMTLQLGQSLSMDGRSYDVELRHITLKIGLPPALTPSDVSLQMYDP